jgi:hypothetical protein
MSEQFLLLPQQILERIYYLLLLLGGTDPDSRGARGDCWFLLWLEGGVKRLFIEVQDFLWLCQLFSIASS